MKNDIDLFGILVPALLLWAPAIYLVCALLRPLLARSGLYRLVWHPALFDLALFVCLTGAATFLSSEFMS